MTALTLEDLCINTTSNILYMHSHSFRIIPLAHFILGNFRAFAVYNFPSLQGPNGIAGLNTHLKPLNF